MRTGGLLPDGITVSWASVPHPILGWGTDSRVTHGFSRGEHESADYSSPPPLKRWATQKAWVPHPFRQKRVGDGLIERYCFANPSVPHPSLREEWGTRAKQNRDREGAEVNRTVSRQVAAS